MGIMEEMGMAAIPFAQWMYMVTPIVLVMFAVVGFILSIGLKDHHIETDLNIKPLDSNQKKVLYVISGLIVVLLVNAPIKPYYNGLGLSEPGILLTAGLLLFAPPFSILNWMEDKENIPYRIMFLFGAGFAIAAAVTKTGMAGEIASHLVTFATMPMVIFLLIIATMVTFTTEITSNTALISIMLPILYKVAEQTGMDATLIMMVATICASYAFMLPIATPPNAIAMSSGVVSVKTMATYGIVFNIVGILLIVAVAQLFWPHLL
jgi:sodium-dependent dicarboxylate transporter 2/3/5